MTIDEAIKLLTQLRDLKYIALGEDFKASLTLGIEALKKEQRRRLITGNIGRVLLPGETEE